MDPPEPGKGKTLGTRKTERKLGIGVREPGDAEGTDRVPEGAPDSSALDANPALSAYLNDHLAGAAAGVQLAKRCMEAHEGTELRRYVGDLVGHIEEDRRVLERVMARVGARSNPVKQAGALGAELLAAFKVLIENPMSMVI